MKNIAYIFTLGYLFLSSCTREYEPPFIFSDLYWHVGANASNGIYEVNQDDYISFMDLSQGAIEHKWMVTQGAYFLEENLLSNDTVYINHIAHTDTFTHDASAHVLFTKSGVQRVRLYNSFTDSVAFKESFTLNGVDTIIPIVAIKQDEAWIMDTTFLVDVYEYIQPAFKVFLDDEEVLNVKSSDMPDTSDVSNWDEITIEVGQELKFVDSTRIGRPNGTSWNINGSTDQLYNRSEVMVAFYKMGSYYGSYIESKRTGNNTPQATAKKLIPLIIKVVQSSQPFAITSKVSQISDTKISFEVSGELQNINDEANNFQVHVVNSISGFDDYIPVKRVDVGQSSSTTLELELSDRLYNSDEVTISYSGGNITSIDNRILESFDLQEVSLEASVNIFNPIYGDFDLELGEGWDLAADADLYCSSENDEIVKLRGASDIALKYHSLDYVNKAIVRIAEKLWLLPGVATGVNTYELKLSVYIPEGTTMTSFKTSMLRHETFTYVWDLAEVKRDKWVTLKTNILSDPAPEGRFDITFSQDLNATGDQIIYLDDISISPVEIRP